MDMESSGDPKSVGRPRATSASRRRKPIIEQGDGSTMHDQQMDDVDDHDQGELNIRVREHGEDDPPLVGRRNRIGGLFKETPASGIKNLSESAGEKLRPLTGIFRRPGSRSGRSGKKNDEEDEQLQPSPYGARSASPEMRKGNIGYNSGSAPRGDYDAVAAAPHVLPSQLHGLLQVDALAAKHPHLAKLDDIDISLLSRFIASEEETGEEMLPYTWDTIFASISTEMREEWQMEEQVDEDIFRGRA